MNPTNTNSGDVKVCVKIIFQRTKETKRSVVVH